MDVRVQENNLLCQRVSVTKMLLFVLFPPNKSWYHNIASTYVFWISWLPRGLKIASWTFFNSQFFVDFRNIYFFIIHRNMEGEIGKIQQRGPPKSNFFFIYCLMKQPWPHGTMLMTTLECSLFHGAKLMGCWKMSKMEFLHT